MEVHFGHRLSRVRVHDGSLADEATRSVGATAYTLGHDIVFSSGAFRPDTIEGLHLLAHELAHVIQQDGTPTEPSALLHLGPVDDPLEGEADRAADALMRNHALSPWQISAGRMQRRLQRAVSKVCNPPSAWFSLGGVPNLPAAVAFGAIAERFISTNIIATTATAPGNFYLDHPLAGPIDPFYVAFIIRKNPGLSAFQKAALALMTVARPDVLLHQAPIFQFEEVKPNSVAGRAAGRAKVNTIQTFFTGLGTPYLAGFTYTPPPPILITSGSIGGVPITVYFEIMRDRNGLLVYEICVETDWLLVSVAALAFAAAVILLILTDGAIGPVVAPALAAAQNGGRPGSPADATGLPGGPATPPMPATGGATAIA
jgi:hypothetical protein